MKPQGKATEFIENFGSKSLDILEETFDISVRTFKLLE